MPSRRLTKDESAIGNALLDETRARLVAAAGGDPVLLFALRRRVFVRLMYDERGTPAHRTRLKGVKWKAQDGLCAICGCPVEQKGSELDRTDAVLGYTEANTRLVCHDCHRADQKAKRFA